MDYEQFAGSNDQGKLALLQRNLEEAARLKQHIDDLEEELKKCKSLHHQQRTKQLPDLMLELGVEDITVLGWKCKLEDMAEGSFPKEEARQDAGIKELDRLGSIDLLKTSVELEFPKSCHQHAQNAYDLLRTHGYAPVMRSTVHPQTLKAFAKELLSKNKRFDETALGLMIGKIVKFTNVKKKARSDNEQE